VIQLRTGIGDHDGVYLILDATIQYNKQAGHTGILATKLN